MFTHVPHPLAYAESLLGTFTELARAADDRCLLQALVQAVAGLSGCALVQLYLLDSTHTRLGLEAAWLDGQLLAPDCASLPADYNGEQLLQFALCQNRVVNIADLSASLFDTCFLPSQPTPWQALLAVPLLTAQQQVVGVLLCVNRERGGLQAFADSLGQLGGFAIGHLQLLRRLRQPLAPPPAASRAPVAANRYGLIGQSAAMAQTCQMISKVLHSPCTVLLRGETGTGKELVARAIHDYGPRRSGAFVVQNCAAFPETLLESELFGYRKGAFTGADRDRSGLFDAADGGTLLLDEIGDMPLALQAKLLRVLQEGEIRPLGSNVTHKIDVRIIAATHRDLVQMVSDGLFREDLYYRLAQFPIELPPLRQRSGDVITLARHFCDKACAFFQRSPVGWSQAALEHLESYAFPGNVRELKGLVERAVLLCEGDELEVGHFALSLAEPAPQDSELNLRERLEKVERSLLLDCLRKHDGNQTLAARELGLPRRTLLYRLGRLNIQIGDCEG
ncbi:sigma 54-interacting transcriptional regulator [Pseudomonas sp. SK]|uniref:sigma 54-interacting transcriptional regulator n=1 Tax=Pseudomonas sp. SK TaxID=2729423 RepID=UPI00146348D2|nr:sigma 54-interacting transcriptional regulator [Pseudomonas sp. SK]QJQ18871.1 sigma 54-interacting transcriptional regulator [Pseudomonas sp. SK]